MSRLRFMGVVGVVLGGCATTVDTPAVGAGATPAFQHEVDVEVETRPVDVADLVVPPPAPPLPAALIEHEGCLGRVVLVRASPVLFENDVVTGLREIELEVAGPPGLTVQLEHVGVVTPPWTDVALAPKVALQLPAGPATDSPAGFSGALFDLGGLAVAGFANLLTLPVSLPLALITNSSDLFFFEPPSFRDGMFVDVVLDKKAWQQEVTRRSAPHEAVLAVEAERQQRFLAFRDRGAAAATTNRCTVDDTGRCRLQTPWPMSSLSARFSGPSCPAVPKIADADGNPVPAFTVDEYYARDGVLPTLPASPKPLLLPVPDAPDERRGTGARRTNATWATTAAQLDDPRHAFEQAKHRGAKGKDLVDADLVCRLKARGDFDVDGSAPDLVVRLAWGFDDVVIGTTFSEVSAWTTTFGVQRATIVPGELVKLSVVDVDAFVDDWVGMDIVTFDGTLPLRFSNGGFSAECRAAADE